MSTRQLPPVPSRAVAASLRQEFAPAAAPRPSTHPRGTPGAARKPPPPPLASLANGANRNNGTPPRRAAARAEEAVLAGVDVGALSLSPAAAPGLSARRRLPPARPDGVAQVEAADEKFNVEFVEPLGMTLGMKFVECESKSSGLGLLAVQSVSGAAKSQHPELRSGLLLLAVNGQSTAEMTPGEVKSMLKECRPVTITFADQAATNESQERRHQENTLSAPRKVLPPVPSRGQVSSLRAELARVPGDVDSAVGADARDPDEAASASNSSAGGSQSAASMGARGRRGAEVETGSFRRTGSKWGKVGQLTREATANAEAMADLDASTLSTQDADARRRNLVNLAGNNLTGAVRHRQKRWDDAAKYYAGKIIVDIDRFGDAAFLAAQEDKDNDLMASLRLGSVNTLNMLEKHTGIDLDGDGDVGERGKTGEIETKKRDFRNSRFRSAGGDEDGDQSTAQFDLTGIEDHILNVVYDKEAGQHRYRCLVKAYRLAQTGQQLMENGQQFWDEAEFRFMCCTAEFCEEAGYDVTFPQSKDSRDITRQLDRKLYFGPGRNREKHDYGLVHVGRLAFEMEEVYGAYANLAYIRFVRASHCLKRMTRLGSTTCEADIPEEVREEWRKLDTHCRGLMDMASKSLSAWLSFLEELESWLARHNDSVIGKSKDELAAATARGEKLVERARQMPDKSTILLGSKLLLLVLFPGYERCIPNHRCDDPDCAHDPPSTPHLSGGHWFPPEERQNIMRRARSTTDFKRDQAHGHCLCSICLATRLYDLGKDWLDLSQHDTRAGKCWTVKNLIRDTAEQEEQRSRAVLFNRILAESPASKRVAENQILRMELENLPTPWQGQKTLGMLQQRAQQAGVNPQVIEVALEDTLHHREIAELNHYLADMIPDLLCVTTVGGWKGFHNGSEARKYMTLGSVIFPCLFYYADVINDIYVIFVLIKQNQFELAFLSGTFILLAVFFCCVLDRYATEHNQQIRPAEDDTRMYAELLPLRSLPLWQRCVMNLSHTRMLYETRWAFKAWRAGRIPRAAYDQVRSVEGLFESTPQAMLQAYLVIKAYYDGNLATINRAIILGLFLSFANTSGTLAMMGQHAQHKWRACFFLFCCLQMVLRVFSLCGCLILVSSYCSLDDIEVTEVVETPPDFCDNGTFFLQYWFFVVYIFITFMGCVLLHVIHMQGHSGGSIRACLRNAEARRSGGSNYCQMILDLTILNPANTYAYVLGFLNVIVPVDSSPFSILKNADPRPPRVAFFLFRMIEIAGMCIWFDKNLRPDLDYEFDFDAVFWILFGGSGFAYMLCLVVPYGRREKLSQSALRAMTWGLEKNGGQLVDHDRKNFKARAAELAAGGCCPQIHGSTTRTGEVGKVKAHPLEKLLSLSFVVAPITMGIALLKLNNWNEIYPQMPTACLVDNVCLNGGRCILVDNWAHVLEEINDGVDTTNSPWAESTHVAYRGPLGYASPQTVVQAEGVPFCVCKEGFAGLKCEQSHQDAMAAEVAGTHHYGLGQCFLQASASSDGPGMAVCDNGTVSRPLTHVWYAGAMYAWVGNATEVTRVKSEFEQFG